MEANGFGPDEVTVGSRKKVWWKCKEKHTFQAFIYNRTHGGGCPYCSGKRPLKGFNTLADLYPSLAEEWDMEANGFGPDEVTAHSGKKVIWRCKKENHSFVAAICKRTNGTNCPYCSKRLTLKGKNDLQTVHPELVDEWDYETNKINPDEVSFGSNKKFTWICKMKHRYEASPNSRHAGKGCPYCNGTRLIKGVTDLMTVHPELVKEWDNDINDVGPDEVSFGSGRKYHWICEKGHHYQASVANRHNGKGCPYCARMRPIQGVNDLKTLFPEICLDWDYEKNKKRPEEFGIASNIKVYWKCHKCGYKYRRSISVEVCSSGCIKCKKK